MGKTNSLTSHHGESTNNRADKMSGTISQFKRWKAQIFGLSHEDHQTDGKKSNKFLKRFYSKKRRQFLKNENNWDKL